MRSRTVSRFVARELGAGESQSPSTFPREVFLKACTDLASLEVDTILGTHGLSQADAETLGPALLVYSELVRATDAPTITVSNATLRHGLIVDLARSEAGLGIEVFSRQVLASARAGIIVTDGQLKPWPGTLHKLCRKRLIWLWRIIRFPCRLRVVC